jgi:hypothetical protein
MGELGPATSPLLAATFFVPIHPFAFLSRSALEEFQLISPVVILVEGLWWRGSDPASGTGARGNQVLWV